jgi:hypothetical protein
LFGVDDSRWRAGRACAARWRRTGASRMRRLFEHEPVTRSFFTALVLELMFVRNSTDGSDGVTRSSSWKIHLFVSFLEKHVLSKGEGRGRGISGCLFFKYDVAGYRLLLRLLKRSTSRCFAATHAS